MLEHLWSILPVLLLILAAEFVNGWTDAPNAIATVVSTRVLSPHQAVFMATCFNILGAMSGTAVAATIGKGIIDMAVINPTTVAAAMVGIIVWSTFAYLAGGIPTSESHALVAGLAGAGRTLCDRLGGVVEGPDRAVLFDLSGISRRPGDYAISLSLFSPQPPRVHQGYLWPPSDSLRGLHGIQSRE
jgi:hypothetical protein